MEEALFLTRFATEVTIIHRRDAVPRLQDHAGARRAHEKIRFLTNSEVVEVMTPAARR